MTYGSLNYELMSQEVWKTAFSQKDLREEEHKATYSVEKKKKTKFLSLLPLKRILLPREEKQQQQQNSPTLIAHVWLTTQFAWFISKPQESCCSEFYWVLPRKRLTLIDFPIYVSFIQWPCLLLDYLLH